MVGRPAWVEKLSPEDALRTGRGATDAGSDLSWSVPTSGERSERWGAGGRV